MGNCLLVRLHDDTVSWNRREIAYCWDHTTTLFHEIGGNVLLVRLHDDTVSWNRRKMELHHKTTERNIQRGLLKWSCKNSFFRFIMLQRQILNCWQKRELHVCWCSTNLLFHSFYFRLYFTKKYSKDSFI